MQYCSYVEGLEKYNTGNCEISEDPLKGKAYLRYSIWIYTHTLPPTPPPKPKQPSELCASQMTVKKRHIVVLSDTPHASTQEGHCHNDPPLSPQEQLADILLKVETSLGRNALASL